MKLTSKLPDLSLTIFSEMTQLADAHGAINLSQGFPDYAVPEELTALVAKYMQQGCNQYAPMLGVQHLREQIAAKVLELYSAKYDPARDHVLRSCPVMVPIFKCWITLKLPMSPISHLPGG